jgi:YidC/Oxa1 family membrane protein insertase
MQPENSRNTIIFAVCAVVILFAYQFLVLGPEAARKKAEAARHPPAAAASTQTGAAAGVPGQALGGVVFRTRAQALNATPRVPIETPTLRGYLSLRGGVIDDLYLKNYQTTVDPNSPPVELLRAPGLERAYFAQFGWAGQNVPNLPNNATVWTLKSGTSLTPTSPLVLTYDNGSGLTFTRTISVDRQYLFTVSDKVANRGGQPVSLTPYAQVMRYGAPVDPSRGVVYAGAIGFLNNTLEEINYGKWVKQKPEEPLTRATTGGWIGITDKYWMATIVPDQTERGTGRFSVMDYNGVKVLQSRFEGQSVTIGGGRQVTHNSHLFAGAKVNDILKGYQANLGAFSGVEGHEPQMGAVKSFDVAIDWGRWFWIFTRPLFTVLDLFARYIGNFGLAILLLTVCTKLLLFPLANQAFASMAKIKKVAPKQEEIKQKYADDPARQQQEMMALYQREKINPLAGCLPIFIQFPIFYSLYKVLSVTIEMRHAPFFGWIQDLSSPDPTTVWNLFGLLPYDPGSLPVVGSLLVGYGFLHIGLWPLMYGVTMALQTSMSPTSPDPTQQMVMRWFPVIFTVLLAKSPAGLVIYWVWSNLLTIIQQYIIMRRHKTANPIDGLIARIQGKEYTVPG